jgi:hypothetical protein
MEPRHTDLNAERYDAMYEEVMGVETRDGDY